MLSFKAGYGVKRRICGYGELLLNKYFKLCGILFCDEPKKIYNQIYRYTSNIEHHNIFFGRDYVNKNRCEPRESLEKFSQLPHLKPPVILYLFRIIYIEVLGAFNDEFKLNWEKKLSEIKKIHEDEYPLLRNN